jgi:hypothetical protein
MPAQPLKLAALDAEDLIVLSAHVQDAILRTADIVWNPLKRRFAIAMNRFAWETEPDGRGREHQRRRAAMHFDRVVAVKSRGFDRALKEAVAELLAVEFVPSEPPAGEVRLVFAGGAEIRLTVECIEAQLADLGAAWQTKARPAHDLAAG